jgi:eukaryotic-like serine/threonine-protein kinase
MEGPKPTEPFPVQTSHYQRVEDLFHAALERGPEYLETACADDPTLRAEVEALLLSFRAWSASLPPVGTPALPRFGAYQCDEILGSGGMGTVYRAHRDDGQFRHEVAIKVLRGSLRSEWYRERFLSERQILARLNHPNIARLLDGGMTSEGEPYLVMELIEGEPLDAYCDARRLPLNDRLSLFGQVLDAVDYAHRNLVVHRDLKPANVLVTKEGRAKLVDFGTSKLVEADAMTTSLHAVTPAYASPEQLRGEPAGVASDVFSAGVILYELITGASPFGASESITDALRRASGEVTAAAPATAVTAETVQLRGVSLDRARKVLTGDLAAIMLKALEPEPARRYGTAQALADDLTRYREGRPVMAKPASRLYRAAKFVRRNRAAVAAGAILTIGLAAATVVSTYQANVARREARRAEQINTFLNDMVGAADPSWSKSLQSKGASVTLLDVVDEMRDRIDSYFGGDSEVEIRLRRTIGQMYAVLSKHAEARTQLRLALEKQLLVARADDPSLGTLYADLAGVEYRSQQATEAERDALSAIRILERARGRANRVALMSAYNYLGVSRTQDGKSFAEQEEPMRRALEIGRELYGNEWPTAVNLSVLATTNLKAGHFDQAEKYLGEAIAIGDARPGPKGYEYVALLRDRARLCLERKDLACAARGYQAALDFIRPFENGKDSVFTINIREWLALTNGLRGNYAEAEREFQAAGAEIAAIGGSTTESYLAGLNELRAQVHMAAGNFALAEHELRGSLKFYREHRQDEVQNAVLASRLGESLARRGDNAEAAPLLRDSYQTILKAMGPNHIWTKDARARMRSELRR